MTENNFCNVHLGYIEYETIYQVLIRSGTLFQEMYNSWETGFLKNQMRSKGTQNSFSGKKKVQCVIN